MTTPENSCSKSKMMAGCACGSNGGGNGEPDNPFESSGLCCDKGTNKAKTGTQQTTFAWCVEYSPPPTPPPPRPPPPNPPPVEVCHKDNMVAGCKCGKTGGGNGLLDNPPSTSNMCCHKKSRTLVTGPQTMTWSWCKDGVASPSGTTRRLLAAANARQDFASPSATPDDLVGGSPIPTDAVCCNANPAGTMWREIEKTQCCDQDTLTIINDGAQCTSTRWCKAKNCVSGAKISKTKRCNIAASPPPPHPPSFPQVVNPASLLSHCCNANNKESYERIRESDQCCDQETLTLVDGGEKCTGSAWCKMKDCARALAIASFETCTLDPVVVAEEDSALAPGPNENDSDAQEEAEAPGPSPAVAIDNEEDLLANMTLVQEEDTGVPTKIERTFEMEADVDVFYDDGNVNFEFHGELVVGKNCEDYQLLADAQLTIQDPPLLNATGDVSVTCPDDAGGRDFSLNVAVMEWPITSGIRVVEASLQLNMSMAGGDNKGASGIGLVGKLSGEVVIDQDALPSAANGMFEMDIFLKVEIEFSKKACPIVVEKKEKKNPDVEDDYDALDASAPAEGPTASYPGRRRLLQTAVERAAAEECGIKLDHVAVDIEFLVQKSQPPGSNSSKPLFWIEGNMSFVYPCKDGDTAEANAMLQINVGEFSVPDFNVEAVFYCGVDGLSTEPVFKLKGYNNEPMELGPVTIELLSVDLVAYTYDDDDGEEEEAAEEPAEVEAESPASTRRRLQGVDDDAGPDSDFAEGPTASDDSDSTSGGSHVMKSPIHLAGTLSGFIVVELSKAELGHPALRGLSPEQVPGLGADADLTARVTFSFDSRTNVFSIATEIRYEDDCVLVVLQVAATKCGEGQVQSVTGTVDFKPACSVDAHGKVSGLMYCSDGDEALGYELSAEIVYLKYTINADRFLEVENAKITLLVGAGLPEDVLDTWEPDEGYTSPAVEDKLDEQTSSTSHKQARLARYKVRRAKLGGMADKQPSSLSLQGKAKFTQATTDGGPSIPQVDCSLEAAITAVWGGGKSFKIETAKLVIEFEVDSGPSDGEVTASLLHMNGVAEFEYPW